MKVLKMKKIMFSRNKRLINNQKHNKMKKVDKSSSAGTTAEQSTNAQVQHVSQPNAKPNVSSRFEHLISAIERQIKMEEGWQQKREMMLATKETFLYNEKLPNINPDYIKELKEILPLLEYLNNPIPDWCEVKNGSIDIPDEFMPLFNKIGMQLRFHTISGKGEVETIAHILWNAQKFFHQFRSTVKEMEVAANGC